MQQAADIQVSHTTPGSRPKCPVCSATFNLGSPRRRGDDLIRQVQCSSCRKTTIVTNSLKARVIVIAQREVVRQMVRAFLSTAGHEVLEAADASIGLWAYGENPADVVFIDVLVPGRMDAGEFVRQLRREHGDARVVAISGRPSYGMADPLLVVKQLGAAKTIRMPFSSEELLLTLEEARP